ncbi:MAG TPA: NAD-dependent malic enzyme [Candidatus Sulfotelmatobacter sp.]|nr:NAD-dependent malic enzyme [Candidatus Sulfotelmatobacter sp.]
MPIRANAPIIRTELSGYDLLNNPRLNKGTAFTEEERDTFALHGLLPPHVGTMEEQMDRRMKALENHETSFAKYSLMRDLQDTNETLFYALLARQVERLLPIVYTPAVGEGCQRFSEIWHKPRGLFISYPNRSRMDQILADSRYDGVKCIVVSDGERILGLGDQGAGGMGIPIGKMALYTALGGIHPAYCLPVLLDVGTDNLDLLQDPIYIGWRQKRVRGPEYDDFVEAFVSAVKRRWPHTLLQWEDFAGANAARILARYRHQLCTFNDDIQGTAAVAVATVLAAIRVTGVPLSRQKIVVLGFGSAGMGIAGLLSRVMTDHGLNEPEARSCCYAIDRYGLLVEGVKDIRPDQALFVRKREEVAAWSLSGNEGIGLADVVRNVKPTILVGVSGQQGAFREEAVRAMARHVQRPIIFPLSNPTSRSEATPQELAEWTGGRALIGTGSPFPPMNIQGKSVHIDQINNSYIFPGLALGIIASKAKRVSDAMILAAAEALARLSPVLDTGNLLPPLSDSRKIGVFVAEAVGKQAIADELAGVRDQDAFHNELHACTWESVYLPYKRLREPTSQRIERCPAHIPPL